MTVRDVNSKSDAKEAEGPNDLGRRQMAAWQDDVRRARVADPPQNWAPIVRTSELWDLARDLFIFEMTERAEGRTNPTGPWREELALSYANCRNAEEFKEDTLLLAMRSRASDAITPMKMAEPGSIGFAFYSFSDHVERATRPINAFRLRLNQIPLRIVWGGNLGVGDLVLVILGIALISVLLVVTGIYQGT